VRSAILRGRGKLRPRRLPEPVPVKRRRYTPYVLLPLAALLAIPLFLGLLGGQPTVSDLTIESRTGDVQLYRPTIGQAGDTVRDIFVPSEVRPTPSVTTGGQQQQQSVVIMLPSGARFTEIQPSCVECVVIP
jgi:hypothetical protein